MWGIARRLRQQGIMGINRRNGEYVLKYNNRRLYPLVDDKLKTKKLAADAGLSVPALYSVVEIEHQIQELWQKLEAHEQFVIKPAQGCGGDGIMVITGRRGDLFRLASGHLVEKEELAHHISSTLSGLYSLGGQSDVAMVEYCVQFDPLFSQISYQGVPDVRVIVFLGYPIMAMSRLPTRMSSGKANLHQGAVGVGIKLHNGVTEHGVWHNSVIHEHPDTGVPIAGIPIPQWDTILDMAARCYELTGLGYLGVDIVLDRNLGPMMLELNARPGLNIQIANQSGLWSRCRQIEKIAAQAPNMNIEDRLAIAVAQFK